MASLWKPDIGVSILPMWQCSWGLVTLLSLCPASGSVSLFIFTLSSFASPHRHRCHRPYTLSEYAALGENAPHLPRRLKTRALPPRRLSEMSCLRRLKKGKKRYTRRAEGDWVDVRGIVRRAAEEHVRLTEKAENRRTWCGDWGTHMLPLSWLLLERFCQWQARREQFVSLLCSSL